MAHLSGCRAARGGKGVQIYFICEDSLILYHAFRMRGIDAKHPFVGMGCYDTHGSRWLHASFREPNPCGGR